MKTRRRLSASLTAEEEKKPKAVKAKEEAPEKVPAGEDSALVEWTKELAAVAATSGVVAGVAVAVEDEDSEEAEEAEEEASAGADGPHDEVPEAETAVLSEAIEPGADTDAEVAAEEDEASEEAEDQAPPTEEEETAEAGELEVAGPKPRKWLSRLLSRKPRQPSRQEPAVAPELEKLVPEPEVQTAQVAAVDESVGEPVPRAGRRD